jgi:hypothetical protein
MMGYGADLVPFVQKQRLVEVSGFGSLGCGDYFVLYTLAFMRGAKGVRVPRLRSKENVLPPVIRDDETESFVRFKPLHGACFHILEPTVNLSTSADCFHACTSAKEITDQLADEACRLHLLSMISPEVRAQIRRYYYAEHSGGCWGANGPPWRRRAHGREEGRTLPQGPRHRG